jgi:lipopolysaccharide biosynthesis glycosyltransferase/glycosyltransferase involved in cell wall biosynthesis
MIGKGISMNVAVGTEDVINVVTACDDAYAQHTAVFLKSLFESNRSIDITATILVPSGFQRTAIIRNVCTLDRQLKFIEIDCRGVALPIPRQTYISSTSYFRLLLDEVLPRNIEKLLYLDSDILVMGSLAELWNTELDSNAVAAVTDALLNRDFDMKQRLGLSPEAKYINAGVLLVDRSHWKRENIGHRAILFACEHSELVTWNDQCALNHVLNGRFKELPSKWNFQTRHLIFNEGWSRTSQGVSELGMARIIHFTGGDAKPWLHSSDHPLRQLYWRLLSQTEWRSYSPPDKTIINTLKVIFPKLHGKIRELRELDPAKIKTKFAQIARPALNFAASMHLRVGSKITRFSVGSAKVGTGRRLKLGIVTNEIFSADIGRMGGFGWAARQVSQCFAEDPTLGVEPVILMGEKPNSMPPKLHGSRVLWSDSQWQSTRRLWKEDIDLLLSIDYSQNYRQLFYGIPRVPIVIWARDPWDAHDRSEIATCRIPGHEFVEPPGTGGIGADSLKYVATASRLMRRPLLFAATTPFIAAKLKDAYGLDPGVVHSLPNIINPVGRVSKAPRPTIVYLGRLDPIKRPWVFAALAERLPHVDFIFMGQNHFEEAWQPRNIPANLHLLGHVDEAQKQNWLSKAWLLVSTSIHEGLCVAFLEALACETPIVACVDPEGIVSRFGAYVGNYPGTGLDAVPKLEWAVNDLLKNTDRRLQLGKIGRAWVSANHNRARFVEALLGLVSLAGIEPLPNQRFLLGGSRALIDDGPTRA